MNHSPLDRIEEFEFDKYYIYSRDEDWVNKDVEQENKVYHYILEINLRYIKKIDNKNIFDCNILLEEDELKEQYHFKFVIDRKKNLIGMFQDSELYKETIFTDHVYGTLDKNNVYYLSDLSNIIFDKEQNFENNF